MSDPPFDFTYLRQLVHDCCGAILGPHKDYLAALHLEKIAFEAGFESIADFTEHLKKIPFGDLHQQAIDALVTKETSFFRDRSPFEELKTSILPTLIQSRSNERAIDIWSAGCSTGQEPYSIAILISECFPELSTWTIRIIASDFSQKSLDRARKGEHTNLEINRGLTPTLRDRYFRHTGRSWQIVDRIRQMVEFRQLNLLDRWISLPKMDIIFLRNVLIYFDLDTKRSILAKVRQHLQHDGYLFLGGGETTFHLDPRFKAIPGKTGLYYRLEKT